MAEIARWMLGKLGEGRKGLREWFEPCRRVLRWFGIFRASSSLLSRCHVPWSGDEEVAGRSLEMGWCASLWKCYFRGTRDSGGYIGTILLVRCDLSSVSLLSGCRAESDKELRSPQDCHPGSSSCDAIVRIENLKMLRLPRTCGIAVAWLWRPRFRPLSWKDSEERCIVPSTAI
jgi:hypothetical protein